MPRGRPRKNKENPVIEEQAVEAPAEELDTDIVSENFDIVAEEPVEDPSPEDVLPGEVDEEAEQSEEVETEQVAAKPKEVVFRTKVPANRCFTINLIRGFWYDGSHVVGWRVPEDQADSFRNHPHVKSGKVYEIKED